jgi:secreted PhoX family phosphatase
MDLSRRQLLAFFGVAAGTTALQLRFPGVAGALGQTEPWNLPRSPFLPPQGFTPIRLPHDLPIYLDRPSFLPTGIGTGSPVPAGDSKRGSYTVIDDVVVPPEFERYVIVAWGDHVFPDPDEYLGFNADYTAFIATGGQSEGYLFVNHEYVGFPIAFSAPEAPSTLVSAYKTSPSTISASAPTVLGIDLDTAGQTLRWGEFMYNQGASVVRIRKRNGRYAPVEDRNNRRYHGLSGLGLNSSRKDTGPDGWTFPSSWGSADYQQGDMNYLVGTGPAAKDVFSSSVDGLGDKIIGTAFNCSGGHTPWGTVLSCEENFQAQLGQFFVGVQEAVGPDGRQTGWQSGPEIEDPVDPTKKIKNLTTGSYFGMVGEKYGWVVEIDPADPSFQARKHTALGRFRHENVALRTSKGKPIVAYMGDDRRCGHVWKYVSTATVRKVDDKANSSLFEDGTLYVARFEPKGKGRWIPLTLDTDADPIPPSDLASAEATARGVAASAVVGVALPLPRRDGKAGQTSDGGGFRVTPGNEDAALPDYTGTLGDFYDSLGAALCDAYLAANLIGGTPSARPEDLEVNPYNPREVIIAFTDGENGSTSEPSGEFEGYADSRIFQTGKFTTAKNATQQSGGLYKIIEDDADGTGTTFTWTKLLQGGEVGASPGAGFAALDNLGYDHEGNIWGVTDMSTSRHNGFNTSYGTGLAPKERTIDHTTNVNSTASFLVGTFGANWLFTIPASGPDAGKVVPFAYGPPRSEMTGPTFVGDTLILSVQHPCEDSPINGKAPGTAEATRDIEMLTLDGTGTYTQRRTVPRGSNWPANLPAADRRGVPADHMPRPAVIGIRRRRGPRDND